MDSRLRGNDRVDGNDVKGGNEKEQCRVSHPMGQCSNPTYWLYGPDGIVGMVNIPTYS
jgi:hypothetical protein